MITPAYRAAVRDLLASFPATLFLTANFNDTTDLVSGRSALRGLHARIDRRLLGRGWARRPSEDRSLAIWLPEHIDTNTHWHGLMTVPAADPSKLIDELPEMWTRIIPSGQLHVQSAFNAGGAAAYMTKDEHLEHFVISSEFNA